MQLQSTAKNYLEVQSPLMTCEQAALFLGISLSAFWRKCREGEIPHIRISSRCYRVRKVDLETFINAHAR